MKIITTITILFIGQVTFGQNKIQKIDSLFTFCNNGKFNGNVLIAEKGKVIYKKSFGFSNDTTKQKLNENSIFELASISKQFTAAAIVMLKEKGKLSFDDNISKYLPELSNYSNITIRNLLNHTSGLPDYMELMNTIIDKTKIATNKDFISWLVKYKPALLFEPNTQYEYSNTGYVLLASIIEKVSGIWYGDYLSKAIFKPLNMNNSFVYRRRYAPAKLPNYAFGYVYSDSLKKYFLPDNLPETRRVVWFDGVVGDKTVNSTTGDLLKWDRSLYSSKLISMERKKEIFTSSELNDKTKTGYGFGWYVEENGIYGDIAEHTGSWPGYKTLIERHLQNDKTIIVLVNYRNDSTYIPLTDLRRIIYNIKPLLFIKLTKEETEKFVGEYQNSNGRIVQMIYENGSLYKLSADGEKSELKPIAKNKFQLVGFSPDVFYEFISKGNAVEKYIMTQPEEKIQKELIKVK
jgi:CubicO group peptidase (beta-lactamase class C family)